MYLFTEKCVCALRTNTCAQRNFIRVQRIGTAWNLPLAD